MKKKIHNFCRTKAPNALHGYITFVDFFSNTLNKLNAITVVLYVIL